MADFYPDESSLSARGKLEFPPELDGWWPGVMRRISSGLDAKIELVQAMVAIQNIMNHLDKEFVSHK
jgi:hypothetical protein